MTKEPRSAMAAPAASPTARRRRRRAGSLAALALFALAAFAAGLRYGAQPTAWSDLPALLTGERDDAAALIVRHVRLPRLVLGAMVGAALALSGTLLQAVMRNALAAPNLIGVTSGGGLGAVLVMVFAPAQLTWITPAAFAGALTAALVVYGLAWRDGLRPMRLVLSGIAVASFLGAISTGLTIFNADRAAGILDFTAGSLAMVRWDAVRTAWPYMAAGAAAAFALARRLNILGLGDDVAQGLGLRVERVRLAAIAAAALLAAASVSVVGMLGFVGLIAPHIARLLVGGDHRSLLPGSLLLGAGLTMACDTAGRMIRDPEEIPVGVVMAVLGAPFFLYLLRRTDAHDD